MQKKAHGIALIQVLLLSAILSVMLISIHVTSREHVELATQAVARAEAMVALNSMEAETFISLLTSAKKIQPHSELSLPKVWRFDNQPFPVENGTIQIEDTSALISLTAPTALIPILTAITGDKQTAEQLVAALDDWQDADNETRFGGAEQQDYPAGVVVRNSVIQDISELLSVKGFTPGLVDKIRPFVTMFPKKYHNIYAMSDELLAYYLDPIQLKQVLAERHAGTLTPDRFSTLTGIEQDEFIGFSVSQGLVVRFTAQRKGVKLSRQISVTLDPSAEEPLQYWDYYKNSYVYPF